MPEDKLHPVKRRSRAIMARSAAAILLMGVSAFALAPAVQTTDSSQPTREMAAAQPVQRETPPRMLENGAPFSFADLVERVSPAVVSVTVGRADCSRRPAQIRSLPEPFRDFFNQFGQGGQSRTPRKAMSMGSGFIIDKSGLIVTNNHVVENAQEDHGQASRRPRIRRQADRHRSADRHRAAQGQERQAAADRRIRRRPPGARRRLGGRRRQSVRPVQHRDRRHRLLDRPRHRQWSVYGLHPDRRADQSRQFRRSDLRSARQGHRHELDDLLAVGRQRRHRLCHSVLDHPRRRRPA